MRWWRGAGPAGSLLSGASRGLGPSPAPDGAPFLGDTTEGSLVGPGPAGVGHADIRDTLLPGLWACDTCVEEKHHFLLVSWVNILCLYGDLIQRY